MPQPQLLTQYVTSKESARALKWTHHNLPAAIVNAEAIRPASNGMSETQAAMRILPSVLAHHVSHDGMGSICFFVKECYKASPVRIPLEFPANGIGNIHCTSRKPSKSSRTCLAHRCHRIDHLAIRTIRAQ